MDIKELRFAGRDGGPCVPGEPIGVYLDGLHAATVDPAPLSADGSGIHLEHYSPTASDEARRLHSLNFGRVSLLAVTAHVAEHFADVTTISYLLNRDTEGLSIGYVGGMRLAAARSAMLQRIGAENILLAPHPEADRAQQFVVSATWRYNQRNLARVKAALEEEWILFANRLAHAGPRGRAPRTNEWLRGFLARRRRPRDGGGPAGG